MRQRVTLTVTSCRKVLTIVVIAFCITFCKKEEVITTPWYPEINSNGDSVLAVYESRIPCPDCERLKLALVVYSNTQSNLPSTYRMALVYVGKNNDRLTNSGDMNVTKGTSLDSMHTVYQLTSGAPAEFRSFWKINEDLLFILDENLTPKVGDAGHGYVLNRIP
jgi:thioredoxin-related protein